MVTLITIVHIFVCFFLILVVLFARRGIYGLIAGGDS